MSGIVGLDYNAIEAMSRMTGKKIKPKIFKGLQTMERAVLNHIAENRES